MTSQENLLLGITEDQLLRMGQECRLSRDEFGRALQVAAALRNRW
jgi:hypothetical protein